MFSSRGLLLLVLVAAAVGGAMWLSRQNSLVQDTARKAVQVQDLRCKVTPTGDHLVAGKVWNYGGRPYDRVEVDITLFDERGDQVGSTAAIVRDVPAESVRTFEVPVSERQAATAKVASITAD